jgi:CRP-like cAMP-binding protein
MGRRSFFGGTPAAPLKLPEKQHIHRESMREAVEEAKTEMDPTIEGKRKRWSHIKMLVKNTDKLYEIMLKKEEKKVVSKKVPSFIWERSGRDVVPVEEDGALEDAAPPPSPAPGSLSPSPSERTVGNRVEHPQDLAAAPAAPAADRRLWCACVPVLHPDGKFRLRWDVAQVVALAYVSLMVPMRLGFDWSAVGVWYAVETALDLYFFLDIFVNFLTALYRRDEGHIEGLEEHLSPGLIIDKRRIARAYLRGWFLVDALACAPVDYFMRGVNGTLLCSAHPVHPCLRQSSASSKASAFRLFKILRVFRVLKLFRLFRLKRLFKKYQDELLYWMPLIQASKLFFMLIFASHWMGCAYATVFPFDERLSQGLGERYVDMVYWAMQTITTVGYGDMVSTKTSARLVSTIAMAVGGLIFGWLIQYVLNVLDPDTFERKQQARIERVMGYLRANALPVELSQRVIRHVRQQNSRQTEDRSVLMELPRQLRADVFEHLYKASLSDVTIFAGASVAFLNDVCTKIVPLAIPQGEVVYGENDLADEGTFIVNSGEIELTVLSVMPEHRNHHKKHHHRLPRVAVPTARLTNGAIFGEESCLGCSRRHDTATACKTSELLTIAGADFRLALDLVPKLRWRILKRHIEQRMRHARNRHTAAKAFLEMDLPELVVGKVQDEVLGVNELTGKTATVDRDISIADDWREVLIGLRGPWEARHTRQHRMAPADLSKTTSFARSNDHLEGVASTQHAGRDDADNGLAPPSRGVDAPGSLGAGGVDVDWIRAEIRQSLRDEFQVELGVYKEAVANEVKFAVAREFERELAAYKAQIAAEVRDAVGREFQREHELFKQEFAAEVSGAVTAALDARSGKLAPLNS